MPIVRSPHYGQIHLLKMKTRSYFCRTNKKRLEALLEINDKNLFKDLRVCKP